MLLKLFMNLFINRFYPLNNMQNNSQVVYYTTRVLFLRTYYDYK